ncbi:MAG TPA: 23S rRNA (guanosine(2251)-2'-O)-methyltransferase RlmB [Trueperaceae bacterium]|nr:23S rRNA (guanosine(2251)-2'-O)-methyltransferase RlmB [Trueperaceae bacterium]
MLIYGRRAVLEALRGGQVRRVLAARGIKASALAELRRASERAGVALEEVPRIELDRALKTTSHQGVAAELPEPQTAALEDCFALAASRGERLLLVLLDHLTDPHNVGAIIRSAEALGAHGVVGESRHSAPLSAVVVKTAAGATSHLPVVQVANVAQTILELKERNVWVYGADDAGALLPDQVDWDRDAALVIGSEGEGLRRLVRERCDDTVRIPVRGRVGSLNASVAAGILIYDVIRARNGGPGGGPTPGG